MFIYDVVLYIGSFLICKYYVQAGCFLYPTGIITYITSMILDCVKLYIGHLGALCNSL